MGTAHLGDGFIHRACGVHREQAGGWQTPGRGLRFLRSLGIKAIGTVLPDASLADVKASAVLLGSQGDLVFRWAELRIGTCNFFQI